MTYYRITEGGEPVAFVTTLGLAREITRCQPPGYYQVDEIPVDLPLAECQLPDRRPGNRHTGRASGAESSRRLSRRPGVRPHRGGYR